MMIGFLPLDTRPCTYDMPVQLARAAGATVLLPPVNMTKSYKEASDTKALATWLEEVSEQCDALVLSAEQLLQGGLIPSREARVSVEHQIKLLEALVRIKREYPQVKIYLSTVLMRTSISTLDSESLMWWEKVNTYSKMYYRAKILQDCQAIESCNALEEEIPKNILQTFWKARNTNQQINRTCIQFAADGIIDELLVLQEDCSPEGIQKMEQEVLAQDIKRLHIGHKVCIFNGTDEAGAELMMKAIVPEGCDVEVVWLGNQKNFVASYEDRPFRENLVGHMAAMNMREQMGAECMLFIVTPKVKQREASFPRTQVTTDYTEEEMDQICQEIGDNVKMGRKCYLLDLDYANGGNTMLLKCLAKHIHITDLYGYSAWNTACNALGTLLAQMLSSKYGNSGLNQGFTADRILDDAIYQELVRQSITARVKESGQDIYNIQTILEVEQWLEEEFEKLTPLLHDIFGQTIPVFQAKLRWPRLFEAAVFTTAGNGPVFNQSEC